MITKPATTNRNEPSPPPRDSEGYVRLSDEKLRELTSRFDAKSWNETTEPEDKTEEKPR